MQPKTQFGEIAANYKAFRPTYPAELFAFLAQQAPGRHRAWDCATGNGQSAQGLKTWFEEVVATDSSPKQIAAATPTPGIQYLVAPAEQTPLADASVDVVTVAQALHWFDLPRFYAEVRRVVRPGGLIACWCYALLTIDPGIDAAVNELYADVLDADWPPERHLVADGYTTIAFPFPRVAAPPFAMLERWNLGQLTGYLDTWSAVAVHRQRTGADPLAIISARLRAAWGDPATVKDVVWPLYMLLGRVGADA